MRNITKNEMCIHRNLTWKHQLWRYVCAAIMCLLFSQSLWAQRLDHSKTEQWNVTWDQNKGCATIKIAYYDRSGNDWWIKDNGSNSIQIKEEGYGWADLIKICSKSQASGDNDPIAVYIHPVKDWGKYFVNSGGWTNVEYNTVRTFSAKPGSAEYVSITIYWYPGENYIGKKLSFKLNGNAQQTAGAMTETLKQDERNITTSVSQYTTTVKHEFDSNLNSNFSYTIKNLNKSEYTTSSVILEKKVDKDNWRTVVTQDLKKITEETYSGKFELKRYCNNSDIHNGAIFRVRSLTCPDGDMNNGTLTGTSPYYQTNIAEVKTQPIAIMDSKNIAIVQNSANIEISWGVVKHNLDNSQNKAGFVVEKKIGAGSWDRLGVVPFNMGKLNYGYIYTLDDREINKGEQEYFFRVYREGFAPDSTRLSHSNNATIHTNYRTVNLSTPLVDKGAINVSWTFEDTNGIWDKNTSITITADNQSTTKSITPDFTSKNAKIENLEGCSTYSISMSLKYKGYEYANIKLKEPTPVGNVGSKSSIINFEASKGYYNDYTLLKWEVPSNESNFDYFEISRRDINKGESLLVTQITHSGLTSYSYQDKTMDVGVIYDYSIAGYSTCNDTMRVVDSDKDYGYCQPYATISGRIAYTGNQSVKGVTVAVVGGDTKSQNKSIYFDGNNAGSSVKLPANLIDLNTTGTYTFQAWINPQGQLVGNSRYLLSKNYIFDLLLTKDNELEIYILGKRATISQAKFAIDTWTHLTSCITFDNTNKKATGIFYINGEKVFEQILTGLNTEYLTNDIYVNSLFVLGGSANGTGGFKGYLDEIRVWERVLDPIEIEQNYSAFISGKEGDLKAYYRCDEDGVNTLFDISGRGSNYNKNHGELGLLVSHKNNAPSSEQLANKAITDKDGNYLINTIPYTSEGLQYNILPMMGIHEFLPSSRPLFVSPSSRVFNSIDYEDVSNFPVSGVVFYEGTQYPVEGVSFYIDGVVCSKDGKVITTDQSGKFSISVPIGEHAITLQKQGHTFVNDGRYPEDPENTGIKKVFDREITNLTFYDNTLVTIAGRVVGGDIESSKPLGVGVSNNNIGRAVIELKTGYKMNVVKVDNGTVSSFENNKDNVNISSTEFVNSKAYRKGGNDEDVKSIIITTDSLTGEFAAKMPPVPYTIQKVSIVGNDKIVFSNLPTIDASNPLITLSDSVYMEDETLRKFEYNTDLNLTYYNDPTFTVLDKGNNVGAFGEEKTEFSDIIGNESVTLYEIKDDVINYTYNLPIFVQSNKYNFQLEGYAEYLNYDRSVDAKPLVDRVPLENTVVTITNQMSASTKVYVESGMNDAEAVEAGDIAELDDNQLTLDANGKATYTWTAGFPSITAPFTRVLEVSYTVKDKSYNWRKSDNPFEGIVFGSLPSGNNFVTSGPDQVLMILRDPAGTASSSYWEEGITLSTEKTKVNSFATNNSVRTSTDFGLYGTTIVGTPGFGVINEVGQKNSLEVGLDVNLNASSNRSWTTSVTTTKRISTSDQIDYVGAGGDVFVGCATNILFGNARQVGLKRANGSFEISMQDAITTGSEFGTSFNYSQNHIENVLLPNLYELRNALLQTVDQGTIDGYVNRDTMNVYLTTLSVDDDKFGSTNYDKSVWGELANKDKSKVTGPSYTMVPPKVREADKVYQDKVLWYNQQIAMWTRTLSENEAAKVHAIQNRDKFLDQNYSFDSGSVIESSVTTCEGKTKGSENAEEVLAILGLDTGFEINKSGFSLSTVTETGYTHYGSSSEGSETCGTTGFILMEDGNSDALTVDVFNAPDGFGAIFVTRGGQTSCPYEGAATTKYYQPGFEISAATMQVEVPKLSLVNSNATDLPAGATASYTMKLQNESETKSDVWFQLAMLDETNPDGAKISIDGATLTGNARRIKVPVGETILKTVQLTQTQVDVLDYKNIGVILASECQNDPTGNNAVIADTVYLSAQFVPSSSPVTIAIEETTMNMFSSDTLTIGIKDYDRNYKNLKAIRLHYKYAGDVNWSLGKEYVLTDADLNNNNEMLPDGGNIMLRFPMSNSVLFPDGKYQFRVQSASDFGTGEVYNYSDIIDVVKDMVRPSVMGLPNPSSGILSAGDIISVVFNENIRNGALTDVNNFIVSGKLNDAKIAHDVAMKFDNVATTASTQADILLANRSFSLDMWINLNSAGVLVEHGNAQNKFSVAINDDKKLVITIGENQYISTLNVPADKWCFLAVNYNYSISGSTLTAMVADDAQQVNLFEGIPVAFYNGTGTLSFGKNLIGAMHEVCLWNRSRSMFEAQSQMHTSKTSSTSNLIGYWKMDEGNGSIAKDAARSRHLTLNSASWYLNNVNKAANLAGNGYLGLDISTCSAGIYDDYMFEMWFRGESQSDATLWSIGDDRLTMKFNDNGKLALIAAKEETVLSQTDYLDNSWHHVAFNVLRNGTTSVYVDGIAVKQLVSAQMSALEGAYLYVGATPKRAADLGSYTYESYFKGDVDEMRYWVATLAASVIKANKNIRMEGNEPGLVAYYPLEKKSLDSYNHVITEFVLTDASENKVGAAKSLNVIEAGTAPMLKEMVSATNIQFGFTASEREVVINLNEAANRIEGSTINFTLRNVRDENNNLSQPITWSAYVNQNRLLWSEEEVNLVQNSLAETKFVVNVSNQGSSTENWVISNMPTWLSVSDAQGSLAPLSSKALQFTVNSSTPTGRYEETIYLCGNDNINVPLVITLKVQSEAPDWNVNFNDYESSMNVVGQLKFAGASSYNTDDMVAAFLDDKCIGVASPIYFKRYDSYYVLMDIYMTESTVGKNVVFKAWDASNGIIYPIVNTSSEVFCAMNALIGDMNTPFVWDAQDLHEQVVGLSKGWNWTSLVVKPNDNSVSNVLNDVKELVTIVKSKSLFTVPSETAWTGKLETIELGEMYKVNMIDHTNLSVVGKKVNPADEAITIKPNWNWIGYNATFNTSLNEAFAGLDPEDGDHVKSQNSFAIYNNYEWVGTLKSIVPGKGYMYMSKASNNKSFTYPTTSSAMKRSMAAPRTLNYYTPVADNLYSGNMTVIGQILHDNVPLTNAEVGVFAGDECRGAEVSDEDGMIFFTIFGEGYGAPLTFKVMNNGNEISVDQKMVYSDDAMHGTLNDPYSIKLLSTGIDQNTLNDVSVYPTKVNEEVYVSSPDAIRMISILDVNGQKMLHETYSVVQDMRDAKLSVGHLYPGVYFVTVERHNGKLVTARIVK